MNNEELYIDNELVDTDGQTKVVLDIKSNLLQDISKIVSNHTYTIKLPKTVKNQRILKHADLVQSEEGFAYSVHLARFFRDGVEVIKNGRAILMQASDSMEISIVWGLFPAFSELVSRGVTLNQLESDARILWTGRDRPARYQDALVADYFYAGINVEIEKEVSTYWSYDYTNTNNHGNSNGNFGGERAKASTTNLHPCVKVKWVLEEIQRSLGVGFVWTGDEKAMIDSLILPLVSKKANDLTFVERLGAELPAISGPTLGELRPNITSPIAIIREESGVVSQFTVSADVTIYVSVKASATYDMTHYANRGSLGWSYDGMFVDMKVTKTDGTEQHYPIGSPIGHTNGGMRKAYYEDYPTNRILDEISGRGVIEVEAGDRITFQAYYCQWNGFGNGTFYGRTTPSRMNPATTFHGGTIEIGVTSYDGSVPEGGYFPIAENLPNVRVVDFVKFLAAITGTFPLQIADDEQVVFVPISTVWRNKEVAEDWTAKLIAASTENKPKEMEYTLSEWKQHNLYKWKEDDTVKGDYDGDLSINNETLELSRDVFTFPFAASDGNRVPMYEESKNSEGETEWSYRACKDRVLRLQDDGNGYATGIFDINMQEVLNTKYRELSDTFQELKVIKERFLLSEAEIQQYDETRPVYLSQYGRYFAVIEIRTEGNGVSDVTLLQLETYALTEPVKRLAITVTATSTADGWTFVWSSDAPLVYDLLLNITSSTGDVDIEGIMLEVGEEGGTIDRVMNSDTPTDAYIVRMSAEDDYVYDVQLIKIN